MLTCVDMLVCSMIVHYTVTPFEHLLHPLFRIQPSANLLMSFSVCGEMDAQYYGNLLKIRLEQLKD